MQEKGIIVFIFFAFHHTYTHQFNNHHRWSIILLCMCELYYSLQQHSCLEKIPSIIAAFCKTGFVFCLSINLCLLMLAYLPAQLTVKVGKSLLNACSCILYILFGWMWKYLNIFVNIFNNNNANNMYNSLKYIYSYKCRE